MSASEPVLEPMLPIAVASDEREFARTTPPAADRLLKSVDCRLIRRAEFPKFVRGDGGGARGHLWDCAAGRLGGTQSSGRVGSGADADGC